MKVQPFARKPERRPGGGWLALLLAGLLALLLCMFSLSIWSAYRALSDLEAAQQRLSEVTRTALGVQRLQFLASELNGWLTHYALDVATGGPGVVPGNVYGLSFDAAYSELRASLADLRARRVLGAQEGELLGQVERAVSDLAGLARRAQTAYALGTPEQLREGYALVRGEAFTAYQAALTPMNSLTGAVIARSDAGAQAATAAAEQASVRLLSFGLGAAALLVLSAVLATDLLRRRERLVEQFRALADTDGLTGLSNRRHWDNLLARELSGAGRRSGPVSLVMLDLDHFKAFNDRFGHQSGDDLLREVAALLTGQLRASERAARYGGEEFSVLLPGRSLGDAQIWLEQLRAQMPYGQNFSAGLTLLARYDTPLTAMARADDALYVAKRSGRARTALSAADQLAPEQVPAPSASSDLTKRLPR